MSRKDDNDERTPAQRRADEERAARQRALARGQPDMPGLFDPAWKAPPDPNHASVCPDCGALAVMLGRCYNCKPKGQPH